MKNLNLNFAQRLNVTNFLASVTGPLGKMSALQHVYEAVRFTDEEMRQVKMTDLGNGMSSFEPPSIPDFGHLEVQIEDADASVLQQQFDSHQQFRIADMVWVGEIKKQLAATSVTAKKKR
jgi:hypothetical protein